MYHLKDAKESNGVVGVFKKNNSENMIHQKTPTVNKVFLSLSLSLYLRKLSLDLMPGIVSNQRKLSQSQDSRKRLEHLTVN